MQERKRDAKATDKKEQGQTKHAPAVQAEDEYDENGRAILVEKDFDNP